jgi:GTP cyclohydrolase I
MTTNVDKLTPVFQALVEYVQTECALSEDEKLNVQDSARRVAKAFCEMNITKEELISGVEEALSKSFPANRKSPGLVVVSPIDTAGLCPHHFLPIQYRVLVALKFGPDDELVGLSKYPRVAQVLSRRPLVQEQYTRDLVEVFCNGKLGDYKLNTKVSASGAIAIVQGVHGCMTCRGVRSNANTITIETEGDISPENLDHAMMLFNAKGMAQ